MNQSLPITINLSANENLASYMRAVNAAPILSVEREYELATKYRDDSDLEAAREQPALAAWVLCQPGVVHIQRHDVCVHVQLRFVALTEPMVAVI